MGSASVYSIVGRGYHLHRPQSITSINHKNGNHDDAPAATGAPQMQPWAWQHRCNMLHCLQRCYVQGLCSCGALVQLLDLAPWPAGDAIPPAGPLECCGTNAQVGGRLLEPQAKLSLQVFKCQPAAGPHGPLGSSAAAATQPACMDQGTPTVTGQEHHSAGATVLPSNRARLHTRPLSRSFWARGSLH